MLIPICEAKVDPQVEMTNNGRTSPRERDICNLQVGKCPLLASF